MTVVFAAIAPHGAPAFDDPEGETRAGFEELARRFDSAAPEATIVLTPHGVHVEDRFAVVLSAQLEGDASQWTVLDTHLACPGEPDLAMAVRDAMRADGLPVAGVTFGSSGYASSTFPLDWGALIPLWFMGGRAGVPSVVVSSSRDRPAEEHVRAGRAIAAATAGRRVALIASADHGHGHGEDGPYGHAPESAEYDEQIVTLVRENRLGDLLALDPAFVDKALADSWWQLLMLHGALGDGWQGELLSYEAPTYFGMLCAAYEPRT